MLISWTYYQTNIIAMLWLSTCTVSHRAQCSSFIHSFLLEPSALNPMRGVSYLYPILFFVCLKVQCFYVCFVTQLHYLYGNYNLIYQVCPQHSLSHITLKALITTVCLWKKMHWCREWSHSWNNNSCWLWDFLIDFFPGKRASIQNLIGQMKYISHHHSPL